MTNRNKLIAANTFALVALLIILTGSNMLGLEIGISSDNFVPTVILMIVPQLGFIYSWLSSGTENKKEVA
jgi:hypothetical protein